MLEIDHFVSSGCQKHDSSVCVVVYLLEHVELVWVDSCFLVDVAADCHEDAGKNTVEEAFQGAGDKS